ncbi:MAG: TatD family hydrolase [Clostridium sp.]|nr:TatD family hydrolase [Clostridium sp.]
MIFDTHAHYDDKAFDNDRETLFENMKKDGVELIVNVGSDLASNHKTLELAEKFSFIYAAIGVHPSETGELTEADIQWLQEKSRHPKAVAIGEIGLDYYWQEPDKTVQKKWFERQLQLAAKVNLPIIVHSRDAAKDTLEILKDWQKDKTGGVIHCFSYTKELAREYLNMDYYFGIGGVLTFKNAKKLVEAVEYIPMNHILLETDCPYLAPEPYRGKRNQSSYIYYVAQKLAEIKKLSREEVLEQTMQNAKKFYNL